MQVAVSMYFLLPFSPAPDFEFYQFKIEPHGGAMPPKINCIAFQCGRP